MTETLIVTSTVDAPAGAVFTVLADPNTHKDIDGTGWLREALDGEPLTDVGQIFRIAMYHDNHPDKHYEMANKVIAFEPDRVIAWEPGSEAEDGSLEFGGWTWRYDLRPAGDDRTEVTYRMALAPRRVLTPILRLARGQLQKVLAGALANLDGELDRRRRLG